MYAQSVEIAYAASVVLGETRREMQAGIPTTLFVLITEKCGQALDPIATGFTTAEELQAMKVAIKTAEDYTRAIAAANAAIPSLETAIKEREDAVKGEMAVLKKQFPQFSCMLDQLEKKSAGAFTPQTYLDRDILSFKADL